MTPSKVPEPINHSPFTIHHSPLKFPPSLSTVYRLLSTVCLLLILAFAFFFSALAVQQHHTFQTNGLDLGNVDQALWNTAQGRFLNFTLMTPIHSRLALHVEPILVLLVPLYWLNLGGPETLLIVQATIVAAGAWPLYQLTIMNGLPLVASTSNRQSTSNPLSSIFYPLSSILYLPSSIFHLTFPLAYLLLPTLESAILFDFHAVTLSPTFLLFAFLALEQKHDRRFLFFALLAMACKEDMPLVVAMLGLYAGLAKQRWRLAGLTLALSAAWFGVAFFLIQPRFAAGGNIQLDRYAWLGATPLEMLQTLLTQPMLVFNHLWDRVDLPGYLFALFFPTAFLAIFSPLTLLPLLPTLAVNLLSNNPFTWRLEDFHYGAPLAPFLFISALYGIRHISAWAHGRMAKLQTMGHYSPIRAFAILPRSSAPLLLCLLLLVFSAVYHYYRGFTPLARPFAWPQMTAHQQRLASLLSTIPADAPLFTQSNLAPHVTHRPVIYTDFAYFTDPAYPTPVKATEILLDITSFENSGGLHQFLRQTLVESGNYQLVVAEDGILHLQPTPNPQPPTPTPYSLLPTPFYTFAHPDSPPDYSLTVDFDDMIRLHGYSLSFNRQEEVQVSVDLEPFQSLASLPELQPVLYLLDAEGQPVGATTDLQPTLVWYPPAQWPVREIVRVRFNTLPWYTRATESYRLALGFVNGSDPWDVSRRYPPRLSQPTDWAVRLPANGTLVELAQIHQVWGMPEGGPTRRQFALPHPPHSLQANFDNQIKLLGYSTPQISNPGPPTADRRPPELSVTLYWQALTTPPNLTRFVQFIGPDRQIYGQNDSAPNRGQYPTSLWQPGEVVIETVTLPIQQDRPSGTYTLHIGLYHPDTGLRLPVAEGSDHVEILP
ncbi:MAG: hypothetical protein BroJett011_44150 [Chloroflexota bacterium]|nr:MAG: hypothetical protein BroJett011_44150 [Chloroflexota bacterium]